ncbi:putative ankyrin repeat protein [Trichoderma lentiforme]|uniref:Ankyrin repeat protein n=1 Tax=Trichoderma lentiforme TaxID=1567552 RepID=A0A9P4X7V3_9HYPO|nr:putative ankyrin repeat protein [Trichoderma lentiforme]
MTTTSGSHISSHGGGSQNVQTGDGPQYNNNDKGHQFNHNNFYGTNIKDPIYEEAERLQKEKEDCLRSLSYQNIDARKIDISSAHPTTCNWLFNTEQFQQWCQRIEPSSHNGVLWIKGNPGTGKSTLMKHTLQYCEENIFQKSIVAAHFFNARGDSFEQAPIGMLRSLLYQLIRKESSIYERFIPLFRDKQQKHTQWAWREPELKNFLLSETQCCPKPLVLFVDALDECSESHVRNLVRFLEDLSIKAKIALNICLSSRHYPNISMEKHLELVVETTSEHDKDIITYAGDKLTKIDEQIKTEVLQKASGVFMWVVLVIEMLNRAYDEGQLEAMHQLLQEVPSDLDEVFLTLLGKYNPRKQETLFMLQFVLFTERLLKPEELYFAALAEMKVHVGPWDPAQITPYDIRRRITHSSRGLIEVRQGGTVQFIHESVKDFLVRNKRLRILDPDLGSDIIGRSHERLRSCCMSYMTTQVSQSATDRAQIIALGNQYPFLGYASTCILSHAELSNSVKLAQFLQLLNDNPLILERIRQFHNTFDTDSCMEYIKGAQLPHMLAHRGLNRLMKILLEKEIDVDAHGGLFGTAIQTAVAANKGEVVITLLQNGANINLQGGILNTALQAAADHNHSEVVAILLKAGANVNMTQGGFAGTALIAAALKHNSEIMTMLLKAGANVNAQGGVFGTALQAAAVKGNQSYVAMLLKEGADINAQGGIFNTALQAAASEGREEIITMLLKEGANINAQGGFYGTALQAAAAKGKKDIVEVLLEAGADIKIQAGAYGTALRAAVSEGHKTIATMLLKEGEKVYGKEDISGTALDTVVKESEKAIKDMGGADVNTRGGANCTSSQATIYTGDDDGEALLELVGKWDSKSDYFSTALQKAIITNDDEEIISVLLKEGVNANTRNIAFKALFKGIPKQGKDLMGVLLKGEIRANCQWIFDTALCRAASKGMEDFVAKLREKGAKFNTRDIFFSYTLWEDSYYDVYRILLENGADINTQNYRVEMEVEPQRRGVYIWLCLAGLMLGILSMFMI